MMALDAAGASTKVMPRGWSTAAKKDDEGARCETSMDGSTICVDDARRRHSARDSTRPPCSSR